MPSYTLAEAKSLLPLVKSIAAEMVERRQCRQRTMRLRESLEVCPSPEGVQLAIAEADSDLFANDEALRRARVELEGLGLRVLRTNPLTIHIPGKTTASEVVFCWMEGDSSIGHGHLAGEEEEPRRPLRVRTE